MKSIKWKNHSFIFKLFLHRFSDHQSQGHLKSSKFVSLEVGSHCEPGLVQSVPGQDGKISRSLALRGAR